MSGRILTLPELIARETNLSPDDAQRLARAWSTEIRLELDQSGISVIRGLGTLTLTQGRVHFQQDPELPIGSDLPAVEGFSAAAAAAVSPVSMASPSAPPAAEPEHKAEEVDDHADATYGEEHLLTTLPAEDEHAEDESSADESSAEDLTDQTISIDGLQTGTLEDLSRDHEDVPDERDEAGTATVDDDPENASWTTDDDHVDDPEGDDLDWSDEEDDGDEDDDEYELEDDEEEDEAEEEDEPDPFVNTPDDLIGLAHAAATRGEEEPVAETDTPSGANDGEHEAHHHAAAASSIRGRSRSPRRYEQQAAGTSRIAIGAMAVILVIIIAAVMYRFVLVPEPPSGPASAALEDSSRTGQMPLDSADDDSLMASTGPAAADSSTSDTMAIDTPAGSDAETTVDQPSRNTTPPADAATEVETAALEPIVAGMGGYTLIVGSTLNADTAESARRSFESLGLRTGVLPYESDNVMRYRIAVGHYPTAALADTARVRRASELPEGTWVLSVR